MEWFMIFWLGVTKTGFYWTSETNNRSFDFLGTIPPHTEKKGLWYQFRNTSLVFDPVAKGKLVTRHYFPETLKNLSLKKLISPLLRSQTTAGMCFKSLCFISERRVPHATKTRTWSGIMWFRFSHNCMEIPWVKCMGLGKIRFDNAQQLLISQSFRIAQWSLLEYLLIKL